MKKRFLLCSFVFLLSYCVGFAQDTLVAVAGTGVQNFYGDGGLATDAHLSNPDGVCTDASGNIYIADWGSNRIRKIDITTGIITTIIDTSGPGFSGDNAPAINAKLHTPIGIFVDAHDNIYIPDNANNRVRKVDAVTGYISTIAGIGTHGYSGDNGLAINAQLYGPAGVFVTPAGDIYITDAVNNVIRKIDHSTGIITTVAGNGTTGYSGDNGPATQAQLNLLQGKCFVDAAGNVFIPEGNNSVVRRVDAISGIITTVAGKQSLAGHYSGDNGLATRAGMSGVIAVYLDPAGNMFISDCNNHVIRKVDASTGIIHTIAGGGTGSFDGNPAVATTKHIYYIWDMWPDAAGNILLADYGWGAIWKLIPCVSNTVTINGSTFTSAAQNASYTWLDCNNGKAPVTDATGRNFTATTPGSYAVALIHNGCVDTSACFIYNPTGINESDLYAVIKVFPSPAAAIVNMQINGYLNTGEINLRNSMGQVVLHQSDLSGSSFTMDVSGLPVGNYIIELTQAGNIYRNKLLKQ